MTLTPYRIALFFHLGGFAGFAAAALAGQALFAASRAAGAAGAARDRAERLAAAIVTRLELPAILVSILSGLGMLHESAWAPLRQGWMHGKLTAVAVLLVTSHLEMINGRKIVKARAAGDDAAAEARKRRQALYGWIDLAAIAAIVALVTVGR
jgi:uncharacterized membrane protein